MAHDERTESARTTAIALLLLLGGCPSDDPQVEAGTGSDATTGAPADGSSGTPSPGEGSTDSPPSPDTEDDGGTTEGPGPSDSSTDDGQPGDTGDSGDTTTGAPTEPGPDLRETGGFAVDVESQSVSLPDCAMDYDVYTPMGAAGAPTVILAHGFQGNRGTMAGWAEHWASWGVVVVAPDLCHATIFDTDHPQNGADLRGLADSLGLGDVVYAGYSAGGLAAVLAAADDARTQALLGLDMVDNSDLGLTAAPGITAPAFDIAGESSQCNTDNNGLAVFQAAGGQALRIVGSDHCDFQSPADFLCGLTCADGAGDDEAIAATVRGLSTAVVLWQTGLEPSGAQWWTPGEHWYEELVGAGIVQMP